MSPKPFSLESVLRYRALLADEALAHLASLEAQRALVLAAIRDLGHRLSLEQQALRTYEALPQQEPLEMQRHEAALEAVRYHISQRQAALAEVDQQILAQRSVLTEKRIDEEALEVLKKRHLERIRVREQRNEALALEEAVMIRTARNRSVA